MSVRPIKIALFCGGRGSASIIRELLRWPDVELTLLVNAYDDGLSTGALRSFIPGMLGPSDFRKNLSYLLDLYSAQQYALQHLIEYRLPKDISPEEIGRIKAYAHSGDRSGLRAPLAKMLAGLDERVAQKIRALLTKFFHHAAGSGRSFDYADCSFGNLVFAGAYLQFGNFNQAAQELATLLGSRARLVNVSRGECRSLLAVKEDGTLLACEAEIVGQQTPVPIRETFFMESPVTADQWAIVADRPVTEKEAWLHARETQVEISTEADNALATADIVLYGPGTQHSSLLPSYRIASAALQKSPACLKVLVLNLDHDNDIQALGATDIVDRALHYAQDPRNAHRVITHILCNRANSRHPDGVSLNFEYLDASHCYRGAQLIEDDFENPADPRIHSGHRVVRTVLDLFEMRSRQSSKDSIHIYIDLLRRSIALDGVLQEFLEIDWESDFDRVTLKVNGLDVPRAALPDYLTIVTTHYDKLFSEVDVLVDWLANGESDYLVTMTGDGEYRLRDVLFGITLLKSASFGVVYGSRTQSRQQFHSSLDAAYGEGTVLYIVSWFGAFLTTALFGARFRLILSDPLTGFRIYRRDRLGALVDDKDNIRKLTGATSITKLLIRKHIEIAEIPVNYRTFHGFTRPSWRLLRGIKNLIGVFR